MKKVTKPVDLKAAEIEFGIELETRIPVNSQIQVGGYHHGLPVMSGKTPEGETIYAPCVNGAYWRADNDSSIGTEPGYIACEFVSPVLKGEDGIAKLREFVKFANRIGAKVAQSCGLHITIGVRSVIGTANPDKVAEFLNKLTHVANYNCWAIYAQTGTDRHVNHYSMPLPSDTPRHIKAMIRSDDNLTKRVYATHCGRGMVNMQKAFDGARSAVEFRAFASTLNESKIMHHLATCFGVMRRAATVEIFGRFDRKNTKKHSNIKTAVDALRKMWRTFGWVDSVPGRDVALGLFGSLHAEFGDYRKAALEMAEKFETRFPNANL
jgi:hypothetical protein